MPEEPGILEPEVDEGTGTDVRGPRIRCPKCGWTPKQNSVWQCTCLFLWNTFDTGGVCPQCMKQWTETACLNCHQWSAHSDWYNDD